VEAHDHPGFAVIEVMATCPVSYGRRNKIPKPADMVNYLKEHTVSKARADKMDPEELADKIVVGLLHQRKPLEYTKEYAKLVERLQGGEE
jgi:2-oxoglutarate ferredoxin oxidoreductase subunit beta